MRWFELGKLEIVVTSSGKFQGNGVWLKLQKAFQWRRRRVFIDFE